MPSTYKTGISTSSLPAYLSCWTPTYLSTSNLNIVSVKSLLILHPFSCVWMCLYGAMCMWVQLQPLQRFPATGIIGDCELPDMDAANWTQLNSVTARAFTARADDALSRRDVSPASPVSFLCTQPKQLQTCSPHFSGTLENSLLQLPINVSSAPLENKHLQDRVSV